MNCTLEDFDENPNKNLYSTVEKKLVNDYRNLDNHSKQVVQVVISKELERNHKSEIVNSQQNNNIIELPKYSTLYYDMPVSAGTGNPLDDEYPENVEVTQEPPRGTNFMVRISGDSMETTYSHDDKLFVKSQASIDIGDIGIFIVDGNAYVKELGVNRLISHNEDYKDIVFEESNPPVCKGKVLGVYDGKIY